MRTDSRNFLDMNGVITGLVARLKYPDPRFFERGDLRMRHDDLRALIHRNADEVESIVGLIRSITGPVTGRVTKGLLLNNANLLHDMRNLANIHGGERGRPYLWEV